MTMFPRLVPAARLDLALDHARLEMNSEWPPVPVLPVNTKLSPVSRFHSLTDSSPVVKEIVNRNLRFK